MRRLALLAGAQTEGLTGVGTDVAAMADLLGRRGFEIRRCEGDTATREGIIGAYERLIRDVREQDAVVFYFSGHGMYAATAEAGLPDVQFIVPWGYGTAGNGFDGITDVELSVLQARLTSVTPNVTAIIDSCHAARMSRDPRLRPKALAHPVPAEVVAEHLHRLSAEGWDLGQRHADANPLAVRLAACRRWQTAFEYTNAQGVTTGVFTESLCLALQEAEEAEAAGTRASWQRIMKRAEERVLALAPGQRAHVEGNPWRLPFELGEETHEDLLDAERLPDGRIRLLGGHLLGVEPGDGYALITDQDSVLTDVTVSTVTGATSVAAVTSGSPPAGLPQRMRARLVRRELPRHAVRVHGSGPAADDMRAALDAAPHVRLATAEAPAVLCTVEVSQEPGRIRLRDEVGDLVGPKAASPEGIAATVGNVAKLARSATLRTLPSGAGDCELLVPYTVEWGRVSEGAPERLPDGGAVCYTGEPIYVRLRNDGDRPLYFWLFDLGITGGVTHITNADPYGLPLAGGSEYTVGHSPDTGLTGLRLSWAEDVPADAPRPESLLVVVADREQDLAALQQTAARGAKGQAAVRASLTPTSSVLESMLHRTMAGMSRELPAEQHARPVRYAVEHLDFLLHPAPAVSRETASFLIDQRPDRSLRIPHKGRARGGPVPVALRLGELVVHRNRALRGGDVRIDALVLTGADGELPAYRAETVRFSGVRDGDRLPLDDLLLYHGPAVDYLDLALWVSRDRQDSLHLSDMLSERLGSMDFKQAAVDVAGLAMAAPQVLAAVTALGATATIVNIAYQLLSAAVGDSIGLYRTSLLQAEGFCLGHHPSTGLMRAQDFSFRYEVLKV
ncbi:caspase family protein [Nonomuraea gerenzanensis]|uniref:caspase family protein n=1 Tax=Nonomuraea gerenzanensis TaxID=93944 RepID=UPI001CDA4E6D|nr:caspase family protein [Nonomuraea gerenzanensis]UBU08843.1 caspase family protein [Nonomuraea gerenzanensis]